MYEQELADAERRISRIIAELEARTIECHRLRAAMLGIATVDVYTREGEEPAHEVMRKIAQKALA